LCHGFCPGTPSRKLPLVIELEVPFELFYLSTPLFK
jgi:hypothetical protein